MEAAMVATSSGPTYFDHPLFLALLLVGSVITWIGIFRGSFWTFIAPSIFLAVVFVVSWPIQRLYQTVTGAVPEGWHIDACLAVSVVLVIASIAGIITLLGSDPSEEETRGESV